MRCAVILEMLQPICQTAARGLALTSPCTDRISKVNSFHYMWEEHLGIFHALELSAFQPVVRWGRAGSFSEPDGIKGVLPSLLKQREVGWLL
jgi:hypothetical protein